jgi:hypothetical protein
MARRSQVARHFQQLIVVNELTQVFLASCPVVNAIQELAQAQLHAIPLQHVTNALADSLARPAQVDFKHLTHVHPRRHTQRVQHDVAGRTVGHVRHVFNRHNLGHHTLVTVPPGHLVTRLQPALDSHVDLDHFQHTSGQVVTLGQLLALFFKGEVKAVACLLKRVLDAFQLGCDVVLCWRMSNQWNFSQKPVGLVDLGALGQLLWAPIGKRAFKQLSDTVKRVGFHDT